MVWKQQENGHVIVTVNSVVARRCLISACAALYRYTIAPDGHVAVTSVVSRTAIIRNVIPCIGMDMGIDARFDHAEYYGRGRARTTRTAAKPILSAVIGHRSVTCSLITRSRRTTATIRTPAGWH